VRDFLESYRRSLPEERRILLEQFRLDVAAKVSGVGSVGLRCALVLLMSGADQPLFLQIKEARRSVLEAFSAPSEFVIRACAWRRTASDAGRRRCVPRMVPLDHPQARFYVRRHNDLEFTIDSMCSPPATLSTSGGFAAGNSPALIRKRGTPR
jgi:hypothetical protein